MEACLTACSRSAALSGDPTASSSGGIWALLILNSGLKSPKLGSHFGKCVIDDSSCSRYLGGAALHPGVNLQLKSDRNSAASTICSQNLEVITGKSGLEMPEHPICNLGTTHCFKQTTKKPHIPDNFIVSFGQDSLMLGNLDFINDATVQGAKKTPSCFGCGHLMPHV